MTLAGAYRHLPFALLVSLYGATAKADQAAFNPLISVILDGKFTSFANNPDNCQLPGFALDGESGLGAEGFSLGESEFSVSANIDDKFSGKLTIALEELDGETEIGLEESFIESTALGQGFIVKGGRFFSGVGYLNQQHGHAWDFADAPLIYRGLWGGQYKDDGVQISWIAPTDLYLQIGAEGFAGGDFPAGGERSSNVGSKVLFANTGGDFGVSHSWQAGLSYYSADVNNRTANLAGLDADVGALPSFTGTSKVVGGNLIYKWAPNGNIKDRNFKLQMEFFQRKENGEETSSASETIYRGTQKGFYIQGIYQFMPQWQTGLRIDQLDSNNNGDEVTLAQSGLTNQNTKPKRVSAILAWVPSEFSRVRLQYSRDESYSDKDNQITLQYTMSLGAHGAHNY